MARIRSNYLERLGLGVEEKKSLDILLKEHPLDLDKLTQFCLKFPLPASYRIYLWKLLLGVLPRCQSSHEFVTRLHHEHYVELKEALQVMRRINPDTPMAQIHLHMFHIDRGKVHFSIDGLMQQDESQAFIAMSNIIDELTDDPVDTYWLTLKFIDMRNDYAMYLSSLVERVPYYLSKEETDDRLLTHLRHHQVLDKLPLLRWFQQCYAGVLPIGCYERVWDKVVAGSCVVLLFVAVALLQTLRETLLNLKSGSDIVNLVSKVSSDVGERVVSRSIDLWQKHGSQLTPAGHLDATSTYTDKGHG